MGLWDEVRGRAGDGVRTVRATIDGLVDQAHTRLDQAEARLGLGEDSGSEEGAGNGGPTGQGSSADRPTADVEVLDIQRNPRRQST